MSYCLFGGKSGVTVVTSRARGGPTPGSQQAATQKTSEQQDEFTALFLPLILVFAPTAGI